MFVAKHEFRKFAIKENSNQLKYLEIQYLFMFSQSAWLSQILQLARTFLRNWLNHEVLGNNNV